MENIKSPRIESIDLLRGLVMILMALDHTRDYFHHGAFINDPTNIETTTPMIFFTRFITHFCAPIFIFLAGTSAYLYGRKKSKSQLAKFLFTRGLWLVFLELTLNNFIWWFDLSSSFINLQVLWAIGFSMMTLAGLVYLPWKIILAIGIIIVAGHNSFDSIIAEGNSPTAILWYFLHQQTFLPISPERIIFFNYPILPWIGIIALGFSFGQLYDKTFDPSQRKKWLLRLGFGAIALFFILRFINIYVDPNPWQPQSMTTFTFISFFNVTKYPPSLAFVLITLGPGLLFLYFIENVKNRWTDFLLVYGRVPFFYYFLHMIFIHLGAILGLILIGDDWRKMILTAQNFQQGALADYGYSLFVVYLVWIMVVLLLFPLCKKHMIYKANNREKWWLSYL